MRKRQARIVWAINGKCLVKVVAILCCATDRVERVVRPHDNVLVMLFANVCNDMLAQVE